jgi:DNA helicase-2/ATP-dependent DNA helicase PcrA
MQNIDKIDLKLNAGTKQKLLDFVTMIQSFQVMNEIKMHSFLQIMFLKIRTRSELKKDATRKEGMAGSEYRGVTKRNQGLYRRSKEIDGARGALSEFMEDVALATDLDKDTSDEDRVALMTYKGLEFPHVLLWEWKKTCFQAP